MITKLAYMREHTLTVTMHKLHEHLFSGEFLCVLLKSEKMLIFLPNETLEECDTKMCMSCKNRGQVRIGQGQRTYSNNFLQVKGSI